MPNVFYSYSFDSEADCSSCYRRFSAAGVRRFCWNAAEGGLGGGKFLLNETWRFFLA